MTPAAYAEAKTGRATVPVRRLPREFGGPADGLVALPGRPTLELELTARLLPLARHWRAAMDKVLLKSPMTASTAWTLVTLQQLGDRVRQTDLANAIDSNSATLVRLVDELETAGLVTREQDETDRRVRRISLTESGRAAVTNVEAVMRSLRSRTLSNFPDEALATAIRLMDGLGRGDPTGGVIAIVLAGPRVERRRSDLHVT